MSSKKIPKRILIKLKRKNLKAFLDFINAELLDWNRDELLYNILASSFKVKKDFWDHLVPMSWANLILFSNHGPEDETKKRNSISDLQEKLREKVRLIMDAVASNEVRTISESSGIRKITADPKQGIFYQIFSDSDESEKSFEFLNKLLLEHFLNLILDLDPRKFKKCPRCGNIYYQFSAREKKYCSTECSGAARQANFRKKKKMGLENIEKERRDDNMS